MYRALSGRGAGLCDATLGDLALCWPPRRRFSGTRRRSLGRGGDMSHYQMPVVIDNGSGVIKAGLAGSRDPEFIYPNIIGRTKGHNFEAEGEQELRVGDLAQERRNSLSIRYCLLPAGSQDCADGKEGREMARKAATTTHLPASLIH